MKVIPIYASAGITGFESPATEYKQLSIDLDGLLIQHPSATFIGKASGDSMQGVGIFDGDLLIVDRHLEAMNHDVIVANFNGEFVCKILDIRRRLLLSANEKMQPVAIHDFDNFSLEGVVVSSIRFHRSNQILSDQ
ncbi:translesion error-prone DNA polymerase V autoproteolytic subunit [Vibrio cholerae]|uniref:LexA family protein n=1 Tax=Vibrio cholerae TaxID=666 RepID=UPI002AB3F7CC|nr:translesion error-prone DNA polymerase V autoproteolytic subunit [Vibrio cholerae]EMA3773262.1 translesion error-prone DNA polymerase V autoproteolytic subunit [Vibrio cholerae]